MTDCTMCRHPITAADRSARLSSHEIEAIVHQACIDMPVEVFAGDEAIRAFRSRRPGVRLPEPYESLYPSRREP